MINAKVLFDAIRVIKGSALTQGDVDRVNAALAPPAGDPALLARARLELGVHETPGPVSTPRILQFREWAGVTDKTDDNARPWCADFVNAMAAQCKVKGSGSGMARSFSKWGVDCPVGTPGSVVVISSPSRGPTAGHVFIATGEVTPTHIRGIGGNQSDSVSLAWWPRARIVASRWPADVPMTTEAPKVIGATDTKEVSDA